jgi:hypothetical protein
VDLPQGRIAAFSRELLKGGGDARWCIASYPTQEYPIGDADYFQNFQDIDNL